MKRNYVFLADGFEELEAVAVIDVLRRAGLCVETVAVTNGIDGLDVTGSHGVTIKAEEGLDAVDLDLADWMIIPGGLDGTNNIAANTKAGDLIKAHAAKGGRIAAICAAPAIVLAPLGVIKDYEVTVYPGMEQPCRDAGAKMINVPVATDRNIITGNGPAAAIEFALAIVSNTVNVGLMNEIAAAMQYHRDY